MVDKNIVKLMMFAMIRFFSSVSISYSLGILHLMNRKILYIERKKS